MSEETLKSFVIHKLPKQIDPSRDHLTLEELRRSMEQSEATADERRRNIELSKSP